MLFQCPIHSPGKSRLRMDRFSDSQINGDREWDNEAHGLKDQPQKSTTRSSPGVLQSELHDPFLGRLGSGQDVLEPAFLHDRDSIGPTQELSHLAGDQQDGNPVLDELAHRG